MALSTGPVVQEDAEAIASELLHLSSAYGPTPLLDLRLLASRLGVGQVLAKDESKRMLGSFKSLGGTYAGLRALARFAQKDINSLLAERPGKLPALVCASDGNHGLAVAAASRLAGARARVFLHSSVSAARARRIESQGASIVWVQGTYDDAVDAAAVDARATGDILVADTTNDADDPMVRDVMAGYGVIAAEVRRQVEAAGHRHPTHLFVQAGVGGLAAAMAEGLSGWMALPAAILVVEPERAACVAAALAHGTVVRIPGELHTAAEMLSAGEASAPAVSILRRHGAQSVTVSEYDLEESRSLLRAQGGPATTPSGVAGLAGLQRVLKDNTGARLGIDAHSRVLIIISEADV